MKPQLVVILGPTATGKSSLGVDLAKKYRGEIISADSRQVYTELDVGTGKITQAEMDGVPHHLLDVIEPTEDFSVADFKKHADKAIYTIYRIGKFPIVVGGTGFYIKALIDDVVPPAVVPDKELRTKLASKSPDELFQQLKELDTERAQTVEHKNPRRLIRAIEIATHLGTVPPIDTDFPVDYTQSRYDILQIGLDVDDDTLRDNITTRTHERLSNGWTGEVWQLINSGVPWDRLKEFGLGYRCIVEYFERTLPEQELADCIITSEIQYAKRQRKWFKRDGRIQWFVPTEKEKIEKVVSNFLSP